MNSRVEEATALDSTADLARAVLIHGPISRADLAEYLGLSLPTLTRLTRPLIDRGLLFEVEDLAQSTAGRPTKPLDVRAEAGHYIGIKLTGEAAIGVLTDLKANELIHLELSFDDRRVSTVQRTVIRLYQQIIEQFGYSSQVMAMGISIGGFVREDNTVGYAPFLGWEEVDFVGPIAAELGLPVYLENDIVAVTAAENWFGLGRGHKNFAVVTVGAGIGYGLVRQDRVVNSRDARIGLGTHIILDPDGPSCNDGYRGCATAVLTIPSLITQASNFYGRGVSFDEIVSLAKSGDAYATSLMQRAGWSFGKLISLIAAVALVDTFVLAGEAIDLVREAQDEVWRSINSDRNNHFMPLNLLFDEGSFTAWARGAAAVAIQSSFERLLADVSGG